LYFGNKDEEGNGKSHEGKIKKNVFFALQGLSIDETLVCWKGG
jgi:hypothetical protein